jgi:hypothetical protein
MNQRRELLTTAIKRHGTTDPERVESHIRGCNLDLPVSEEKLSVGAMFEVWVKDGKSPGKYGAPVGEDPAKLGVIIAGRHLERYRILVELTVIKCYAADFPLGVVTAVGGGGGGIQYFLPPQWLVSVERIL